MSIYKRVAGNLIIQTVGATDTVTFEGLTANTATVIINGDLTVSGNASLTGNISGDKIFNGTTSIEIPSSGSNALISVNGTSNVFVVSSTGANITGTANVTSTLEVGANITGANLNTAGNVWIARDASAGQPTIRFTDTDIEVADGQTFGSLEWFTSDDSGTGARVTAAIRAVAAGTLGNANIQILTSSGGAAATTKVTIDNIGNVGVANVAPLHKVAVTGTIYGSQTLTIVGNVTGGNLLTAGSSTATGNVQGGNISTVGLVTVTGNVTGGNLITAGSVNGGSVTTNSLNATLGSNLIIGSNSITGGPSNRSYINGASGASTSDLALFGLSGNVTINTGVDGSIDNTWKFDAAGNLTAPSGGNIITTGNAVNGNLITSGLVTVTGNITGGNLITAGNISANNITATTSININGNQVATVDDATALAIALG